MKRHYKALRSWGTARTKKIPKPLRRYAQKPILVMENELRARFGLKAWKSPFSPDFSQLKGAPPHPLPDNAPRSQKPPGMRPLPAPFAHVEQFLSAKANQTAPGVITHNLNGDTEIHVAFSLHRDFYSHEKIYVYIDYSDADGKIPEQRPVDLSFDGQDFYKLIQPEYSANMMALRLFAPAGAYNVILRICDENAQPLPCKEIYLSSVRRGLSAIIPLYKEEERIGRLLSFLEKQTAATDRYELIFIVNGEKDSTEDIVRTWMADNPHIDATLLYEEMPSAANARNTGIHVAKFSHLAFIDGDDAVSPAFMESFIERAAPWDIPMSHIAYMAEDGSLEYDNPLNEQVREVIRKKEILHPGTLTLRGMSTKTPCKAVPGWFARCVPFDVGLYSGEDVIFFCDIYASFHNIRFNLEPKEDRCVYYYSTRENSLSRRHEHYNFSIEERMDGIVRLNRILGKIEGRAMVKLIRNKIDAQADFTARYIENNPDKFPQYLKEIEARGIEDYPYQRIAQKAAQTLALLYCFPPDLETSAIVAAKRICDWGYPCDVISNDLANRRQKDWGLMKLITPYLGRVTRLRCPVTFYGWRDIRIFAEKAVAEATRFQTWREKPYERLYSRSHWPASHFAAMLFKVQNPDVHWIAEFSDPLLYDLSGQQFDVQLNMEWLMREGIIHALQSRGINPDLANDRLFYWCELATYALADELLFTNKNQRDYMLSYMDNAEAKEAAARKATIHPHSIPKEWYNKIKSYDPDPRKTNLAYFGTFYKERGAEDILTGLRKLSEEEKTKVRFYIFSLQHEKVRREAFRLGLWDVVICKPPLAFRDFLASLDSFDALIVTDTRTGENIINPYLPSKLSDYAVSNTPILALYEEGSMISQSDLPRYKCNITDKDSASQNIADTIRHIIHARQSAGIKKPGQRPGLGKGARNY